MKRGGGERGVFDIQVHEKKYDAMDCLLYGQKTAQPD